MLIGRSRHHEQFFVLGQNFSLLSPPKNISGWHSKYKTEPRTVINNITITHGHLRPPSTRLLAAMSCSIIIASSQWVMPNKTRRKMNSSSKIFHPLGFGIGVNEK